MYLHNVKLELFRVFKDQLLYHTFGMAVKILVYWIPLQVDINMVHHL
jgi:hypothetical protein